MPPTTDLDRIEAALVRVVRGASSPRVQAFVSRVVGTTVERSTYVLLRALDGDEARPVTALAAEVGLDASTVSRQVAGLERSGLVRRSPVPGDRRVAGVRLTDEGAHLLTGIRGARHELLTQLLSGWDPDELATLAPLIERLADDLHDRGGTA